jgi:hypothetical protein
MMLRECVAGLVSAEYRGDDLFFAVATRDGEFLMPAPCTLLPEDTAEWSKDAAFRVRYHPQDQFVTFLAIVRY